MNLYEDLGVPKQADKATIKRAYRKKAQRLHPDRPNGNAEKFHAITRAYDILSDDARRAHYDATGTDGFRDRQGAIHQKLAQLFMALVENHDADHADIISIMKQAVLDNKNKTEGAIRDQEKKIAKYERTKKRISRKVEGENLFVQMLDGQISLCRRGIEMGKAQIGEFEDMLKMIAEYSYAADAGGPATMQSLMQIAGVQFR